MKILTADVGGTFIKYAAWENMTAYLRGKISTPLASRTDFFNAIKKIYEESGAEGIALSLPGVIDSARGICVKSAALGYNNGCNIVNELGELCKCPVAVENDARCAAMAEAKFGALSDVEDGFVMVFGTMIGGALIKNHEVCKGANNSAGEISFMRIGHEKIFSDVCSVPALLKGYAQIKNLSTEKISGEVFFQAVNKNENDAVTCLDKFTRRIAEIIFNMQLVIDVSKFAIGGGISAQPAFVDSIRDNLEKIYFTSPIEFNRVEIVPCKFRNDANLIGALAHYLKIFSTIFSINSSSSAELFPNLR
ncbi:MAG: ROK family protein [Selenomonadaceae bacterium]|nr:ROK family protein [Selenomonadaceae bacterium]